MECHLAEFLMILMINRSAASAFYYPIHSLITEQLDPGNGNAVFTNAQSLDMRGLDFALSRKAPGGLEGTVSYSYQDVTNPSTRLPVTNSPKHLLQANLSVPVVAQKVFASMDLQYLSRRATLSGQYTAAYAVPNFTLFTRDVLKGWQISASLYNAFNMKYADPAGNGEASDMLFQDGRTFRVKIARKF